MKSRKFIFLIIAISIISTTGAFSQTDQGALKHMDEVTVSFNTIKKETWNYLKAVTRDKSARKVDKERQELINEIKSAKTSTEKIGVYNSDESLKNAVIEYLNISYIVLKEDFDKILDMEEIAEQSFDQMEAYLTAKEKANDKLDSAFMIVQQVQKIYAANYGINLIEGEGDKISQKIEKASEAIKYYNQVYLIFFKVYKQEAYVLDAQMRNDVSGIEQNSNAMTEFADEGLEKLKTLESYKGDASLKSSAQQMMKFYKDEAEEEFPKMVDYYIKKDNYEKIKAIMDSKKKKDVTQEDVDKYNKAVNEYNKAVQSYNAINENLNNNRAQYLKQWNDKVKSFFDKHAN